LTLPSKPRVLVCAPSNSAVDVLCQRFITEARADIPDLSSLIFRAFAPSRFVNSLSPGCKDVLNFTSIDERNNTFQIPEGGLGGFRMVFCTLSFSFTVLSSEGFSEPDLILVDEAGQALESETLLPIAFSETIASVVLAGDPFQLGPTCMSRELSFHKLNTSLLERLMQTQPYMPQADSETEFDARYVVKLVKNFRSHDGLLEVPRQLFYNHRLEACGNRSVTHQFVGWKALPNPELPIVLHHVRGEHRREGTSTSLLNLEEIVVVKKWIKLLLAQGTAPGDIGVISPYQQQCKHLARELRSVPKVTIGTVEKFQGDERRVIVVSTVRCQHNSLGWANRSEADITGSTGSTNSFLHGLGFLVDPKRFNVTITRAQSVLIIVGDFNLLKKSDHWRHLIRYGEENHCVRR
jgi:helicase MOV-10